MRRIRRTVITRRQIHIHIRQNHIHLLQALELSVPRQRQVKSRQIQLNLIEFLFIISDIEPINLPLLQFKGIDHPDI